MQVNTGFDTLQAYPRSRVTRLYRTGKTNKVSTVEEMMPPMEKTGVSPCFLGKDLLKNRVETS